MSTPLDNTLSQLQIALADELLKRVGAGTATAADLNVARQLEPDRVQAGLKDNNVQSLPQANPSLGGLRLALPFPESEAG
jgi:hypothetical protein